MSTKPPAVRPGMNGTAFAPGMVFRDTYGEKPDGPKNHRHVQLLSREPDGRWLVQGFSVSESTGKLALWNKTRVKEATLSSHYARTPDLDGMVKP